MSLNLAAGDYPVSLRFFEAGAQVGKSPENTIITVTPGSDVSVDILPLYGEVGVALDVAAGDAVFDVRVPNEVVDEAGGLPHLHAVLSVVGANNPLQEFTLKVNYFGSGFRDIVTLTDMHPGELTVELTFTDNQSAESLGNCIETITLSATPTTYECGVSLTRRSVLGGSILSTVGINVIDAVGAPVSGATISVNGEDVAITNSAAISTPGYSKLTLAPGDVEIEARFGDTFGSTSYTAEPLTVDNLDLPLNKTVILNDQFDGASSGSAAPTSYWYGGITPNTCPGTSHSGYLFLGSIYNDPSTDWCDGTTAVTEHNFIDTGIIDAGGFTVELDVHSAATIAGSKIAVGLGGDIGNDPNNYQPESSANLMVQLSDFSLNIDVYDDGDVTASYGYSMPFFITDIEYVKLIVTTSDFSAGAAATMNIVINHRASIPYPATNFTWDGGNNHIQITGTAGSAISATGENNLYFDGFLVKPI